MATCNGAGGIGAFSKMPPKNWQLLAVIAVGSDGLDLWLGALVVNMSVHLWLDLWLGALVVPLSADSTRPFNWPCQRASRLFVESRAFQKWWWVMMMMRKLISFPSMSLFMMTFFHLHQDFFLLFLCVRKHKWVFWNATLGCVDFKDGSHVCVCCICVCLCVCVFMFVCERERKREREWQVSFKRLLSTAK